MRFGFFKDAEELRKTLHSRCFTFMDAEGMECGEFTPYDFLHGNCEIFACFLWKKYGWPVRKAYSNGRLAHAFCIGPRIDGSHILIDARGGATDLEEFWGEFSVYLFGFVDKPKFYENLEYETSDIEWLEGLWNKRLPGKTFEQEFVSAEIIDSRFPFWLDFSKLW